MYPSDAIVGLDDQILVTGASGFIGKRVVASLLEHGFRRIRCLIRPSSDHAAIEELTGRYSQTAHVEIMKGNLLSREDCARAVRDVAVIYHLAVGAEESRFQTPSLAR